MPGFRARYVLVNSNFFWGQSKRCCCLALCSAFVSRSLLIAFCLFSCLAVHKLMKYEKELVSGVEELRGYHAVKRENQETAHNV